MRAWPATRCCGQAGWAARSASGHTDRLGHNGGVNLLKGGIVYSNFVTTVSPNHSVEARYGDHGNGLGHALHVHQVKFGGVLNGVDYASWNPQIPAHFTAVAVEGKYENKRRLRERLWLRDGHAQQRLHLPAHRRAGAGDRAAPHDRPVVLRARRVPAAGHQRHARRPLLAEAAQHHVNIYDHIRC
ncbi:glycogen/starch synthase [Lentzea alba]|uniref:glycogen/starch synthase n=1 Tax=Lentzea alba TaxID=2714351 RepID=UPI0039BF3826